MFWFDRFSLSALGALLLVGLGGPVQAQHHGHSSDGRQTSSSTARSTILQAPGQAVFGAVQEAVRRLEADSTTDWSQVDVARLRRHLLDMHRVAVHVTVEQKAPIENGVRLRVRPTTEAARASLDRVLDTHPHMLKQEAGWSMAVEEADGAYVLRTTTDDPADTAKIRALGYMGLLAYGQHHQRHHWHLVNGKHPHHDSGQ
jgi:hypothetical protein